MKVLVVGASGRFAGMVVPELVKRGATVRGLVRDEEQARAARHNGAAETAVGDLNDESSLGKAVEGMDGVFHIGPGFAPDEAGMGKRMVAAAKGAKVRKFCFSGVIHPSLSKMRNHAAKLPVEEALCKSGMDFTVLQPTMFMQNLMGAWPKIVETGKFALPFSAKTKVSYVDYRDVAEAAAIALTTDRLAYGTFELSAPGMVTRAQMAEMMGEVLNRKVEAAEPSFEEWAKTTHLADGSLREGLQKMYEDYDQFGFPGGNGLVMRAVLEREPRSLRAFLEDLAKQSNQKAA